MLSNSIKQERIFLFVDNESARSSLISMYSPLEAHNNLLRRFQRVVTSAGLFVWTARAPSASNIADAPLRAVVQPLIQSGSHRVPIRWSEIEFP